MQVLLLEILRQKARPEAVAWLEDTLAAISDSFEKRPFYYAFSGVSRHFDKQASIEATPEQIAKLDESLSGFTVSGWDEFRLARVILLLALGEQETNTFLETIQALLNTADLREQAAIFSAYPLLPSQEDLIESAVDGLRSNIVDVFDSIALQNPFPAARFTDEEWNQMVLKTFFINRPFYKVYGIDDRANADLTAAICDLAHERWAAGRTISPEAWRNCIGQIDAIQEDLAHLVNSGDANDRSAVALVLSQANVATTSPLAASVKDELALVQSGKLSWDTLGQTLENPDMSLNGTPSK